MSKECLYNCCSRKSVMSRLRCTKQFRLILPCEECYSAGVQLESGRQLKFCVPRVAIEHDVKRSLVVKVLSILLHRKKN